MDEHLKDFICGKIDKKKFEQLNLKQKFTHGTRVKHDRFGEGTIRDFRGIINIGIEFDKRMGGHTMSGICKDGYGWYSPLNNITAYFDTESNTWKDVNE